MNIGRGGPSRLPRVLPAFWPRLHDSHLMNCLFLYSPALAQVRRSVRERNAVLMATLLYPLVKKIPRNFSCGGRIVLGHKKLNNIYSPFIPVSPRSSLVPGDLHSH
jgi:hypothetical protein